MEQLIWLAVNLNRNRHSHSEREKLQEQCFIDTIDNEVFKGRYYNSQDILVDTFAEAAKYEIGTYNTFKLMSKRYRLKEDSIVPLKYNREDGLEIVSIINKCFQFSLYELSEDLHSLNKNQLYDELVKRYRQDVNIQLEMQSRSGKLMDLLQLNNPVLSVVDLAQTKVWDFRLERFPVEPKKLSSKDLLTTGNIIALGVAILLVIFIIKYGIG
ncbi:MAG: hypothetical protein EOO85_23365 [Pedobacter sp.]|nr:MAG: hypothetical protein EOO85_23365 [Pedobacter sp.]